MNNLVNNPQDLMNAVAVLEQNGVGVFESVSTGLYLIVTGGRMRDGYTRLAIIEMAKNLKTKETSTYND